VLLAPSGGAGARRVVCEGCGRCWDADGREVDTLSCPGCDQRVVCESRPTALVTSMTSVHQLPDGADVLVRPLLYSDRNLLTVGYGRLSAEGRRRRFFAAPPALSDVDLEYLTNLDYRDHFAWAAFDPSAAGRPGIAVARYIRDPTAPGSAEAAVTVIDDYQRRGVGTLLLLLLADQASANGITTFVSHILWANRELVDTLVAAGARVEAEEPGVARLEIDIPGPESPARLGIVRATLREFGRATRAAWDAQLRSAQMRSA
jgi:GNAT superfamily N-acetyltransferase